MKHIKKYNDKYSIDYLESFNNNDYVIIYSKDWDIFYKPYKIYKKSNIFTGDYNKNYFTFLGIPIDNSMSLHFKSNEIVKKNTKEEIDFYINTNKYNI